MEEMAKHPWLMKRGDRYYLRARVPADLTEMFEGREVKRALRTSDRREADRLIRIESAKLEREFEEKRRGLIKNDQPIENVRAYVLEDIAHDWFREGLEKNAASESDEFILTPEDLAERVLTLNQDISHYKDALARRDPKFWVQSARKLLKRHQIDPETDKSAFFRFCLLLGQGRLESAQRSLQSLSDGIVERNADNPFAHIGLRQDLGAVQPTNNGVQSSSTTIGRLIELFKADPKREGNSAKGKLGHEVIFRALEELYGADAPVSSIDREKCREMLNLFEQLPVNGTKKFPGMGIRELAAIKNERRISKGTLKGHMSYLSAIFAFAVREHMIDRNPASSLYSMPNGARIKRLPFSPDQLQRIFSHSPFDAPLPRSNQNPSQLRNAQRYWAPLLCLWSGMRSNECLQLGVSDVHQVDGIFVFNVGPDEKRVDLKFKSRAAVRIVPVHSKLIEIGFLEFVKLQMDRGHSLLFPDADIDKQGYRSDKFGKWFSRHLTSVGAKTSQTAFHSFRHNFRDALRDADVSRDRVLALGGWTRGGGAEEGYGSGPSAKELAKEIEKITYPGLDLSHLMPR